MSMCSPALRWVVTVSAVVVGGLGIICVGGWTTPATSAPPAAVIGVIDLQRVTKGLNEIKDRNLELNKKAAEFQKQLDDLAQRLTKINDDLKLLPGDSKDRRAKFFERVELEQQAKARQQVLRSTVELDAGEILSDMYKRVTATAAKVAGKDGYTLIMLDDRSVELPKDAPDEEVNRAIFAKRILFADASIDLTDRIITEMNSEYEAPASRSTTAPKAAPQPPSASKK